MDRRGRIFTITGMAHGPPLATGSEGCGKAGAFLLDVGISSSQHIAKFFELTGVAHVRAEEPAREEAIFPTPPVADDVEIIPDERAEPRWEFQAEIRERHRWPDRGDGGDHQGPHVHRIDKAVARYSARHEVPGRRSMIARPKATGASILAIGKRPTAGLCVRRFRISWN